MYDLPKAGDLIGRKYEIVKVVGSGGMGVVYEAMNVDTEGHVALKWLNPQLSTSAEAVERFKREAKVTARIQHPNVVAVHDCGEHEGQLYLVMELLRGRSLREQLSKGPMPVEAACRVLLPVLRGVAAAHAAGVLHRDLKPENIFLCDSPDGLDPIPKVLDFGIAKLGYAADGTALSVQSAVLGTYQYMAPEQLRRQADLDARADVYAMGVVLYRMLTGELPYIADNPVDLALQVLQSEAPRVRQHVPATPPEIDDAVARALARDRSERFATMHEFAAALEPFAGGLRYRGSSFDTGRPLRDSSQPRVQAQPTPFVPSRPTARRGWQLPVLAALSVGALAAAGFALWPRVSEQPTVVAAPAPSSAPQPAAQAQPPAVVPAAASLPEAQAPQQLAQPAQPSEAALDWQAGPGEPYPTPSFDQATAVDAGRPEKRRRHGVRTEKAAATSEGSPAPASPSHAKREPVDSAAGSWGGRGARVRREDF